MSKASGRNEQKKAAALAALLESSTLSEAAERAEISRKTLYNYIREDHEFSLAYRGMMEEAAAEALERLQERETRAAEVVSSILEDEGQSAGIRLKAAHEIMAAAARQRETVAAMAAENAKKTAPLFENLF